MQTRSLGFIGLGAIGAPLAERLIEGGHRVVVHDVVPAAVAALKAMGAEAAGSPAEVASKAEIVFASLPTPKICLGVALGEAGIVDGSAVKVYVETSTAGTDTIERIAAGLSARGIGFVDAPVSGGAAGVRGGHLAVMAAGAPDAVEAVRPAFASITDRLFVVGERPGQGQIVKMANQLLNVANLTAACEALAMTTKAGLDPHVVLDVVNAGSGRNSSTEALFAEQMLTRRFSGGARLDILHKDIALAVAEANRLKAASLVGSAIQQAWTLASNEDGDQDFTNIYRYFERWAGLPSEPGR
jgi:2-hydroxy-3-oxopropionate reductase